MGDDKVYIMDVYNAYIYPGDKKAKRKSPKRVFFYIRLLVRDTKERLRFLFFTLWAYIYFLSFS